MAQGVFSRPLSDEPRGGSLHGREGERPARRFNARLLVGHRARHGGAAAVAWLQALLAAYVSRSEKRALTAADRTDARKSQSSEGNWADT